ncbi:uncharacterized protein [Panulirus ornatus]|uniref:uncharacterized protein n=1 Tax=Panulirus ornatus TaxID=150431 RepID=UPI003A8A0D52
MSQRGNRPRSWCPRGDSPMRLPEGTAVSSPVAAPGVHGLPPAVASPRSTPTPFKLRRLSMGADRAGSPCISTPTPATVLPALHMAAAQLEQQQQRQAAQQAAQQAAAEAASHAATQIEQITTQLSQQSTTQVLHHQQTTTQVMQQATQQSGVFYPMPQHPSSPTPFTHQRATDLQRSYRHSPILLKDPFGEVRSPPHSRPGSVIFREHRDPWSPMSCKASPAIAREQDPRYPSCSSPLPHHDRDPRSPTPAKPSPLIQSERDFRSPTPSRPFPFRQMDRDVSSPLRARSHPLTQRQREPWSPTRPSPLAQRDRDPLSPTPPKPSPIYPHKERDPHSPTPSRLFMQRETWSPGNVKPSQVLKRDRGGSHSPRSPMSPRHSSMTSRGSSGTPLPMFGFPGPDLEYTPSTQELIERQSQDFVDERLAEFQAQIQQLQGKYPFVYVFAGGSEAIVSCNLQDRVRKAFQKVGVHKFTETQNCSSPLNAWGSLMSDPFKTMMSIKLRDPKHSESFELSRPVVFENMHLPFLDHWMTLSLGNVTTRFSHLQCFPRTSRLTLPPPQLLPQDTHWGLPTSSASPGPPEAPPPQSHPQDTEAPQLPPFALLPQTSMILRPCYSPILLLFPGSQASPYSVLPPGHHRLPQPLCPLMSVPNMHCRMYEASEKLQTRMYEASEKLQTRMYEASEKLQTRTYEASVKLPKQSVRGKLY